MNLFVLSELMPDQRHVGWTVSHTLEAAISSCCNATFIYPTPARESGLFNEYNYKFASEKVAFVQRCKNRLFKSWFEISDLPSLGKGPNVLLVVGLNPHFLLSMYALGPLLNQFDLRIGYLLDGFGLEQFDRLLVNDLDHLFVLGSEMADDVNTHLSLSASFLPLATDALRLGSNSHFRFIDVIGYGRMNVDVHHCLQTYYNQTESTRIYHHSTFSEPEVENLGEHILLLTKLLANSKLSLCFEPSYIPRFQGYSPILYRWFEGWSCGCTIVGKKPFGKGVAELMDWENSTFELPDNPSAWIPFLEELLQDDEMLRENTQRNYRECLLRHDWRYRLRDLFQTLDLPQPDGLKAEISQLAQKAGGEELGVFNQGNNLQSKLSQISS
jgi:hypothetical protein